MKPALLDYDIYPKVSLVNRPTEITTKPLGAHVAFSGNYNTFVFAKEYRLAKYVRFLLDAFTPPHDKLCFEEGRLMKAYATGDADAAKGLEFVAGRMQNMYRKYFALEV